jgi:hypothetical protein
MTQLKKIPNTQIALRKELLQKYSPRKMFLQTKNMTVLQASKADSLTLNKMMRENGADFTEGVLQGWILYLNEMLNLKRPMTEEQIELSTDLIFEEYGSLKFTDLSLLFKKIISGKFGGFYESLSIDKLLTFFQDYYDQKLEANAENSKLIHETQKQNEKLL